MHIENTPSELLHRTHNLDIALTNAVESISTAAHQLAVVNIIARDIKQNYAPRMVIIVRSDDSIQLLPLDQFNDLIAVSIDNGPRFLEVIMEQINNCFCLL